MKTLAFKQKKTQKKKLNRKKKKIPRFKEAMMR